MTGQVKTHASRAEALSHLAAADCISAKLLFDHSRWRESAILALQSMEKYITSASESIRVKPTNKSENDVHSLDQALSQLADRIARYNQSQKGDPQIQEALSSAVTLIRENVFEGYDFHLMHNWLRYPRWNQEAGSQTTFEADEHIAGALIAKISELCIYLNDIKKFCVTPHHG